MNDQSSYLVRSVTGPIILITIGVLFAFDRFTEFRFSQTWPVLLIVVGLLRLVGGSRRGTFGRYQYPGYTPPPPPAAQPGPTPSTPQAPRYEGSGYDDRGGARP